MTKPIRVQHFAGCVEWWGGTAREGRAGTDVAWKVTAGEAKARGYNLDIKNPHVVSEEQQDAEELLLLLDEAEAATARVTRRLQSILGEALLR